MFVRSLRWWIRVAAVAALLVCASTAPVRAQEREQLPIDRIRKLIEKRPLKRGERAERAKKAEQRRNERIKARRARRMAPILRRREAAIDRVKRHDRRVSRPGVKR
jgi:hypothetical protein